MQLHLAGPAEAGLTLRGSGTGGSETGVVVGFDLDLTLIDPRAGFAAVLDVVGAELGVALPSRELSTRLGPPLDLLLTGHLPDDLLPHAVERFRALYPSYAVDGSPALPGAHDALAAVHASGGRVLVVTGKFTPNAQRHLDHLGLAVDDLVGEVWGVGKGAVLRAHGAAAYVGDHVHDVEGARAAGVTSVAVATGPSTEQELRDAGADVVLTSLRDFPAWWRQQAGR